MGETSCQFESDQPYKLKKNKMSNTFIEEESNCPALDRAAIQIERDFEAAKNIFFAKGYTLDEHSALLGALIIAIGAERRG